MPTHHPARADLGEISRGQRDVTRPIVLIGFQSQGNLGIGYLGAVLDEHGYRVEIIDVDEPPRAVVDHVVSLRPLLVGFSLIFQFYVDRFAALSREMRALGVDCHFTIGGHFPSLSSSETVALMPELDSVVRFEGELTLLELADHLSTGRDWRGLQGLVYRDGDQVVRTPDRPLISDLDVLPRPHRSIATRTILGRQSAQLIASRGCARRCSFCSIHMFYRTAPGKVVRTRRPAEVADEMRELYDAGSTVLLFQDDDFPIFGPSWRRWTRELLDEIRSQELVGRVLWKINCRADAVDADLLSEMRDAGLYFIYMGLESGNEQGLLSLNKQITVEQNIRATDTLKELGILFDFGFMMLEPSSTFESIEENLQFLWRIAGDGYAPAEFCRMVPYDGTPVKDLLVREGRLRGDVINPDYDFLDPRLEKFFRRVTESLTLTGWLHGLQAVSPQLKFAMNELAIMERLAPELDGLGDYREELQATTRESNAVLFDVVERLVAECRDGKPVTVSRRDLHRRSRLMAQRIVDRRNEFVTAHHAALLPADTPGQLVSARSG